jgi:hypothetical protein
MKRVILFSILLFVSLHAANSPIIQTGFGKMAITPSGDTTCRFRWNVKEPNNRTDTIIVKATVAATCTISISGNGLTFLAPEIISDCWNQNPTFSQTGVMTGSVISFTVPQSVDTFFLLRTTSSDSGLDSSQYDMAYFEWLPIPSSVIRPVARAVSKSFQTAQSFYVTVSGRTIPNCRNSATSFLVQSGILRLQKSGQGIRE